MGSFSQLTYQVVFGGKYRHNFLEEHSQDELFSYMGSIIKKMGCIPLIQGGHVDHVHLVFSATGKYSVGKIVQEVKKKSNIFMHDQPDKFPLFQKWQIGYGAFSYRYRDRKYLINYVKRQKEHHMKTNFKDEYVSLLEEFGIEYDPRYLFE